jgi:ABC-2 type transport system ATP-binding protein
VDEVPVIECRQAGKVYRRTERAGTGLQLLTRFFQRKLIEHTALRAVDLVVRRGEMVGLIGSNGAGKTTLVKCLTGIVPVTSGEAHLLGRACNALGRAEKQQIALVMGQRSQLVWDVPPIDSFRLLQAVYDVDKPTFDKRVREQAERLGVTDKLTVQLRQLSLGERMKMEIIGAFLHDPVVAFLDEPTIGLDLVSQEAIRGFLRDINRERGVTILLTSHDMADIEETCDRLVILDTGAVLFDGDLVALQARLFGKRAVEVHLLPGSRGWAPEMLAELAPFDAALVREAPRTLTFEVPTARTQAFIRRLFELFEIHDLSVERQPLEHLVREIFRSGELRGAP